MAPEVNALTKSTGGVFNSVEKLSDAVKALGERFNLVQPGGAVGGDLPMLYAAGISFVFVDQNETYRIPGRSQVGIGKNALDRIAAAAGVRWNPHLCGRVDNGQDPNLVEYQAVGTVLQLDGTERMITAVKRIDLRADTSLPVEKWGSDAQEIARVAAKAEPKREPWPQILQQRQHILSLAESKAKNRAIRSLGVRTAYEPGELSKGFAIMRLQFTGRSEDPEVEREVSMMIARRALGAASMLYGSPSEAAAALPPSRPSPTVPRVTTIEPDHGDEEEHQPDPGAQEVPAAAEPAGTAPAPKEPADDPLLICGKKNSDGTWPKKPCSALSVSELKAKIAAYEKKRPEWDKKWAAKNEAELNTIKSWLAYREMDPRQAELNMNQAAAADKDEVPY